MNTQTPTVKVEHPFTMGQVETFENCEAYQNHTTGELVVLELAGGTRQAMRKRGEWSLAMVLYGGDVVATLIPMPPSPDYFAEASELNWPVDPTTWKTEIRPALMADPEKDGCGWDATRTFRFAGFRYNRDTNEILGADYRSEDGKTLRVSV